MPSRTRLTTEQAPPAGANGSETGREGTAVSLRARLAMPCNQADMPVYVLLLFLLALGSAIVGFAGVAAPLASTVARVVFLAAMTAALIGLLRAAPR